MLVHMQHVIRDRNLEKQQAEQKVCLRLRILLLLSSANQASPNSISSLSWKGRSCFASPPRTRYCHAGIRSPLVPPFRRAVRIILRPENPSYRTNLVPAYCSSIRPLLCYVHVGDSARRCCPCTRFPPAYSSFSYLIRGLLWHSCSAINILCCTSVPISLSAAERLRRVALRDDGTRGSPWRALSRRRPPLW